MGENRNRYGKEAGRMTPKQGVLSVYPKSVLVKNHSGYEVHCYFEPWSSGVDHWVFCLPNRPTTPRAAWKHTWKRIQEIMLEKLAQ